MAAAADQSSAGNHPKTIERGWAEGVPEVPPLMQAILTEYSRIPADEVQSHVVAMRERAWAIYPYPCIGMYNFLSFHLSHHPLYNTHILPTLRQPVPSSHHSADLPSPLYLELGVCLGQDIRALLHAGVPPARVYGGDVEPAFQPIGYDLFRDAATFPPAQQLAPIDLLEDACVAADGPLARFLGRVDILHLTSVFHLFAYEPQVGLARRVLRLMRPGSVLVGSQTAHEPPAEYPRRDRAHLYRHNVESWEAMWRERVTDNGVIRDPEAAANGARLRFETEIAPVDLQKVRVKGLEMPQGSSCDWLEDPGFRWMKFAVWVDPPEAAT